MSSEDFWRSNVCCIVTGASRGFGKAICLSFARRFLEVQSRSQDASKKISFVLMGRNRPMLDELQKALDQLGSNVHVIEVIVGSLEDLKTLRTFENALQTFGQVGPKYDHAILIHNAGSLSDPNKLVSAYNSDDSEYLINYLELNFNSVVKMTGSFLRGFSRSAKKTIVNVTSLVALEAFKGLALYGAVKAARDAYFRSVALEDPTTSVLSYAPGILDTNMAIIMKNEGYCKELYNNAANIIQPEVSAERMINVLENKKYSNGQHVDFYDVK